jgi:hypothetical protein
MRGSIVASISLLCIFSQHGMEKSSFADRCKKKFNFRKKWKEGINHLLLYNVSDVILFISNETTEKTVYPNTSQCFDLPVQDSLTIRTEILTKDFLFDGSMRGLQRFKINATVWDITINPWDAET